MKVRTRNDFFVTESAQFIYRKQAEFLKGVFEKGNIKLEYAPNRQEALSLLLHLIPEGVKVAAPGNSLTLLQVGILAELRKRNKNKCIFPYEQDDAGAWIPDLKEAERQRRRAFTADICLSGINAITRDGKLVNTDGGGNRVAPTIYGPRKVIFVAGVNKVVDNLEQAHDRIHGFVAPIITRWIHDRQGLYEPLMKKVACVRGGRCIQCRGEYRLCNYTVIIEGSMIRRKGRINVVLVGEELGI